VVKGRLRTRALLALAIAYLRTREKVEKWTRSESQVSR
jgi:hypothetical protein